MNAFEESQHAQMILLAEFTELEKRYLETVRMLEESQNESNSEPPAISEQAFASEVSELKQQSIRNESGIFVEKVRQKSVDSTVETIALTSTRLNHSLSEG